MSEKFKRLAENVKIRETLLSKIVFQIDWELLSLFKGLMSLFQFRFPSDLNVVAIVVWRHNSSRYVVQTKLSLKENLLIGKRDD